jgi:YfiH family protein
VPIEWSAVPLFRFNSFPRDGLAHAVSTRHGGVSEAPYDTLNLSLSVGDDPLRVLENRRRFAAALGFDPARLVSSRQVHGDDVLFVDDRFRPDAPLIPADIQITNRPGWLLTLRFADCVPVLLFHPGRRVVAAVHAGWRGTLRRAPACALRAMRERYDVEPGEVLAGIGPSIGPCCYEVGPEVASEFRDYQGVVTPGKPRPHLDLWEANRQTLVSAGVPVEQIEVARVCTRCRSDLFFSHRAQGFPAGRFSGAIGLWR